MTVLSCYRTCAVGTHQPSDSAAARSAAEPTRIGERRVAPADRGSVTVELAVALPALVAVFAVCLAGIACLTAQLRCTDAAREAARLAARGDGAASSVAAQLAPGASISISVEGSLVRVRVSENPVSLLPSVEVVGEAVAAVEPP